MKREFKRFLCVALLSFIGITANGQSEEKSSEWDIKIKKPTFSGYIQAGYQYNDYYDGVNTFESSSFQIKRMRFIAKGEVSERVSYVGQLEGYSTSRDAQGKSLISIIDLFVNVKIYPWMTLSVGQFPLPISIDTHDIAPGYLETPDISLLGAKMACRNSITGITSYGRDTGVKLSGDFLKRADGANALSYILALTNGSQTNALDDNNAKDITGRIMYRPTKNITLSATGRKGVYTDLTEGGDVTRYTYSFGAIYDNSKLLVRAEYVKDDAAHNHRLMDEVGFYATAGYRLGKIMPLFRYDTFRIDHNDFLNSVGNEIQFTTGFLWMPHEKVRVQAYYIRGELNTNLPPVSIDSNPNYDRFQLILCLYF